MKHTSTVLVFLVLVTLVRAQEESRMVNITQGPVIGYKVTDLDVLAFYGIPYATAPTGTDKFKAPLPPRTWTEPFEARDVFVVCHQHPTDLVPFEYREDCLVANVFVPITNETDLPVMFYIHGGGFQMGFSNWETPTELVNHKKNVIVVTMNYRLGPLGFLCLGTEEIPGNAAMKDQVAALRWVRDNIASFGGNPDDVTIAGCSAGGASVDLLQISKMAQGLFKKVIGQSGANVAVFAVQRDPTENGRQYARKINYEGEDNLKDLVEFYTTISHEQLFSVSNNDNIDVDVRFSACLERDLGSERFLYENPVDILTNGDYVRYPLLYGYADMEGLYRIQNFEEWSAMMNEDFSQFLPYDLEFESEEQKNEIANEVKEFYFGNQAVSGETIQGYIDYNSDVMFVIAMHRSVTLQAKAGNNGVYLHVFSFTDNNTPIIPHIGTRGATHCAQTEIVIDPYPHVTGRTPEYEELEVTMRDLWLNFILTGNPTPEGQTPPSVPQWQPAGEQRSPVMHIGSHFNVTGPFEEHRQKFWDDLYDRFHRPPVAPYDFNSASSTTVALSLISLSVLLLFK